jgi:hypothetical protein
LYSFQEDAVKAGEEALVLMLLVIMTVDDADDELADENSLT